MNTGYVEVQIDGMRFLAHRLAWFYVNGSWPKTNIDHRDRDRANNRYDNLREATQAQNTINKSVQSNNKLGVQGVVFDRHRNKFRAYVNLNGKHHHGGRFDTLEEAKAARDQLSLRVHGEFSPAANP